MHIILRKEIPADVAEIGQVITTAFLNAPHTSHTEQWIVNALRNPENLTLSLVAEADGKIVGQVAISPVTISDRSQNWYGLGPIAVDLEHQDHLMRKVNPRYSTSPRF